MIYCQLASHMASYYFVSWKIWEKSRIYGTRTQSRKGVCNGQEQGQRALWISLNSRPDFPGVQRQSQAVWANLFYLRLFKLKIIYFSKQGTRAVLSVVGNSFIIVNYLSRSFSTKKSESDRFSSITFFSILRYFFHYWLVVGRWVFSALRFASQFILFLSAFAVCVGQYCSGRKKEWSGIK